MDTKLEKKLTYWKAPESPELLYVMQSFNIQQQKRTVADKYVYAMHPKK